MSSDRKALIRLASTLPKGDLARRTLLAELQKQSFSPFEAKIRKVRVELDKLARKNLLNSRVVSVAPPKSGALGHRIIVKGETLPSGPTIPSISDMGGSGKDSEKVMINIHWNDDGTVEVTSQVGRERRKERIRNAAKMQPKMLAEVCFFNWYSGLIRK